MARTRQTSEERRSKNAERMRKNRQNQAFRDSVKENPKDFADPKECRILHIEANGT